MFTAIIPARYASTRLPGKPLIDFGGKPMVVRVAQRAAASGAQRVVVATDDARVAAACERHAVDVVMTSADHASGTDRLAEAATLLNLSDDAIVVNVQGDEPLIPPSLVRDLAAALAGLPATPMASVCHPIHEVAELSNTNVVKVVLDKTGHALYFSRATIPWARDAFAHGIKTVPEGLPVYRHVGMYAYRAGFLRRFSALAAAPIERFEALEQLRVLWHGERIRMLVVSEAPPGGVDTPEDVDRVRAALTGSAD